MTDEESPLAALVALMPPPGEPRDAIGEWSQVEEAIGLGLPADYKRFIEAYGSGSVDDFVHVFNPFADNLHIRFVDQVEQNLATYREIRTFEHLPFPIHPEPGGLLPWASTSNGDVFFWRTEPTLRPDRWSVAVGEVRGPGWFTHPGPLLGFLCDWLTGAVNVAFMDGPPEPVFVPARPWAETKARLDAESAKWRAWPGYSSPPGPPGPGSPNWPPTTTEGWIEALRAGTGPGRDEAAEHLGGLDDSVLPALVELLDGEDPTIWVVRAVLGHGTAAVPQLLAQLERRGGRLSPFLAEALGGTGDDAVVEPLLVALASDDHVTRAHAATGLARLGRPETSASLVAALSDREPSVREAAALALAEVGDRDVAPNLYPLLDDGAWWVRAAVARAVGVLNGEGAVKRLRALLVDSEEQVRVAATEGLGATGSAEAVTILLDRLSALDPRLPVREDLGATVTALGMLRDGRAREPLRAILAAAYRDWRPAAGHPTYAQLATAALAQIDSVV